MPNLDDRNPQKPMPNNFYEPYKLAQIGDPTETLVAADATLAADNIDAQNTAAATMYRLDWTEPTHYGLFNAGGPYMLEPLADGIAGFYDRNLAGSINRDVANSGSFDFGNIRFRHGRGGAEGDFKGSASNILYADGHVETQTSVGELQGFPNYLDTGLSRRVVLLNR